MIYPSPLKPGDKVAVISPATVVKEEYVRGLAERLATWGLHVVIAPHALGPKCGTYAASCEERLADLLAALQDPEIKCIVCARGGYGCNQLIANVPLTALRDNPKWIVGFSDVSALHALWLHVGVASVHGPMAKHFATTPDTDPALEAMHEILFSPETVAYRMPTHELSCLGTCRGILRGGNLAVLNGLAATDFDLLTGTLDDTVLFIEDIGEQIYEIERMLMRMHLAGALHRLRGLIVGQFTEYHADANFPDMYAMLSQRLRQWAPADLPIWFGFPTGHTDENLPLIEGAIAEITIDKDYSELKMLRHDY